AKDAKLCRKYWNLGLVPMAVEIGILCLYLSALGIAAISFCGNPESPGAATQTTPAKDLAKSPTRRETPKSNT
ncbi:hypothetical protein, partial [Flavobacterium sp. ENC]|uniref:hypothetical protein n=1 Tax=Flavobacterium sp. ENC TaxID=2897330 RepID=UPI001E31653C